MTHEEEVDEEGDLQVSDGEEDAREARISDDEGSRAQDGPFVLTTQHHEREIHMAYVSATGGIGPKKPKMPRSATGIGTGRKPAGTSGIGRPAAKKPSLIAGKTVKRPKN